MAFICANGVFREWMTFQKFTIVRYCLAGAKQDGEREKEAEKLQVAGARTIYIYIAKSVCQGFD